MISEFFSAYPSAVGADRQDDLKGISVRWTVAIDEVREAIKIATPMLQSHCKLKLITGLRQTDLLGLTVHNVKEDYLEVLLSKTEDRTEQMLQFN